MDSVNDQLASPVGVSPFGYLRLIACLQLTEAFRSLPRPSSPASAKASIMHPFQACPPNLAGKLKSCVFFVYNSTKFLMNLLLRILSSHHSLSKSTTRSGVEECDGPRELPMIFL
jgi:hypothetical protein